MHLFYNLKVIKIKKLQKRLVKSRIDITNHDNSRLYYNSCYLLNLLFPPNMWDKSIKEN